MKVAKGGKEESIGHIDKSWDTDELARLFNENKELLSSSGSLSDGQGVIWSSRTMWTSLFFLSIYLFDCTGPSLRHANSLVTACGIEFPDQRLNLAPLHWEHGVSAIGPSGKSQSGLIFKTNIQT